MDNPSAKPDGGGRARGYAAALYAVAAALAALGAMTLGAEAEPELKQLREALPLAALLGGGIGWVATRRLPSGAVAGALTGLLAAVAGLGFFVLIYLFADALIAAALGQDPAAAVDAALTRLGARLPIGGPLAALSFAVSGALLGRLGALRGEDAP